MPKAKIIGVNVLNSHMTDQKTGEQIHLNGRKVYFMVKNPDVLGYETGECFIRSLHPKQGDLDGIIEHGAVVTMERNNKGRWKFQPGEESEPDFVL